MKKIQAYLRLIRIENALISQFAILLYYYLSFREVRIDFTFFLISFIIFFSLSAGNIINDIIDIETDRNNNLLNRPLVQGIILLNEAKWAYFFCVILSILLASKLNFYSFLLVLINTSLLFLYSTKLKTKGLFGNILVSYFTASIFLFCAFAVASYNYIVLPMLYSFFIHLIRELVKDMEDMEGDLLSYNRSFPIVFGKRRSKNLLYFLSFFLITLLYIPIYKNIFSFFYFFSMTILITLPLILLLINLRDASRKRDFHLISQKYKFLMLIALLLLLFLRDDIRYII